MNLARGFAMAAGVVFVAGAAHASPPSPPAPCARGSGGDGVGRPQPEPWATAEALAENRRGSELYAQRKFAAAAQKYTAALAQDPGFGAARLNLACALARQDRLPEASEQALRLIEEEFVPWSREVHEATDLAVLHTSKERARLDEARARLAPRWGQAAQAGLVLVARIAPAPRARGFGVFTLGPRQELFSYRPDIGRFLQLTAEDGRVLAHARSPDGRTVVYVRAGKLVRRKGASASLRELSLRLLDLGTLSTGAPIAITGDVTSVDIGFHPRLGAFTGVRAAGPIERTRYFQIAGATLRPLIGFRPPAGTTRLTAAGVTARRTRFRASQGCDLRARDDFGDERPRVTVKPMAGRTLTLPGRYGSGLFGLPLPGE